MEGPPESTVGRGPRIQTAALATLWAFTALAVAGYATFARHPGLLPDSRLATAVYSSAFTFFARTHVVLAGAVLATALTLSARGRWLGPFVAAYALSLLSELAGTTTGLPFGPYRYTDGLGAKWFGHVPLLIPASWFFMAVPSYLLARRAVTRRGAPRGARRGARESTIAELRMAARAILFGSLTLLAWDLALDPAMSWATKYWVWGREGPYYGMPLLNLFGWYVTGVALMAVLAAFRMERMAARVPTRWFAGFYLANLALPLGIVAAHGAWPAVAVSAGAVALALIIPALVTRGSPGFEPVRAPSLRELV